MAKVFDRVWQHVFSQTFKSHRISGQAFRLILSFLSNRQLRIVLDGYYWSSSRLYSWSHINDPPDDVICNTAAAYADTTVYSKCDQGFDLWQQPELAFELESDL